MLLRYCTLQEAQEAAQRCGLRFEGTESGVKFPRVSGRLLPPQGSPNPYQRVSASYFGETANGGRRKVYAVCWHGFRDFYRALFELQPSATAESALTKRAGISRYTADNFEAVYEETAFVNVGAPIAPLSASAVCSCREGRF